MERRKTIVVDDGYLLLAARIFCPDARLIVKNGRAGISFKSKPVYKKEVKKWKKN